MSRRLILGNTSGHHASALHLDSAEEPVQGGSPRGDCHGVGRDFLSGAKMRDQKSTVTFTRRRRTQWREIYLHGRDSSEFYLWTPNTSKMGTHLALRAVLNNKNQSQCLHSLGGEQVALLVFVFQLLLVLG